MSLNKSKCICLECNDLAELCNCDNTLYIDEAELAVCEKCKKLQPRDDMCVCEQCNVPHCLRCNWETDFKDYCEECAAVCNICDGPTAYYIKERWTCPKCFSVVCEECLDAGDCDCA